MPRLKLKSWEKFLIIFAILLFLLSLTIYVTRFPIRNYIFQIDKDDEISALIGNVKKKTGALKRQALSELQFKEIEESSELYSQDIIFTDADSRATLDFLNGTVVELEPGTMIRLEFQRESLLAGVNRQPVRLAIVTGKVVSKAGKFKLFISNRGHTIEVKPETNQAVDAESFPEEVVSPADFITPSPLPSLQPAPSPRPSPVLSIELNYPEDGAKMVLERFTLDPKLKVQLGWSNPVGKDKVKVKIWKMGEDHARRPAQEQALLDKTISTSEQTSNFDYVVEHPGKYAWSIEHEDQSEYKSVIAAVPKVRYFTVEPEYEGIQTLAPLLSEQENYSNKFFDKPLKEFRVTLRWKKYLKVKQYHLTLSHSPDLKTPLYNEVVDEPIVDIREKKFFIDPVYYRIKTKLENGFIATSGIQKFQFNYLPPATVHPTNLAELGKQELEEDDDQLLLTWEKTNFTDQYQIQIAKDDKFSQFYFQNQTKSNYVLLKHPPAGQYWWRVQSLSQVFKSPMSSTSVFKVLD